MNEIDYEITDDDIKFLSFRAALIKFIGPEKIIEKIIEIVNNSKNFHFNNDRTVKYFTVQNPHFTVSYNKDSLKLDHPNFKVSDENDEINWINDCLHKELFIKVGDFLIEKISEFGLKSDEENHIHISTFKILSTIYSTLVDVPGCKIAVRYILL